MSDPRNTIWYLEARPWQGTEPAPGNALPGDRSMGSAVVVELEEVDADNRSFNPNKYAKFLLTCAHVVRSDADGAKGWGPLFGEVLCWQTGKGYTRTLENMRKSGDGAPVGALRAKVHITFDEGGANPVSVGSVAASNRLPQNDWVLLRVDDPGFQFEPAVKNWSEIGPGSELSIIGYPGGAMDWKTGHVLESSRALKFRQDRTPEAGMLLLEGAEESRSGMSGGGIFDSEDRLVGIHRGNKDAEMARSAISTKLILEVLAKHRLRAVPPDRAVGNALKEIETQMNSPGVRGIIIGCKDMLGILATSIFTLGAYKGLHDTLHTLQSQFRMLTLGAAAIARDRNETEQLSFCATEMRKLVVDARLALTALPATPASLRKVESDWIDRMEEAVNIADQAIQSGDATQAKQCVFAIKRLLRQEPPRIDRILVDTAASLELRKLKDTFGEIAAGAVDSEFKRSVTDGQTNVDSLSNRISSLVQEHTQWQSIEQELWELLNVLPANAGADPSDFDALWVGVRTRLKALLQPDPTSKRSMDLNARAQKVDDCRGKEEWAGLGKAFNSFREAVQVYFYSVDSALNTLSGEISKLGDLLQSLLQRT